MLGIDLSTQDEPTHLPGLIQANERGRFLDLLRQLEISPPAAPNGGEFTLSLPGRGPRLFKFFLSWIQETGQICALLDDITEQRVLERRMQQKEKSVLLESLVGGIAHEINNKLSPIMGFADLLSQEMRKVPASADLRHYCQIIRDSATESANIIRQLLQLSRPGKAEITRCDLKQMVQDAVQTAPVPFPQSRLPGPTGPASSRNVSCRPDAAQLKQVIINLMLNAADAMEGPPAAPAPRAHASFPANIIICSFPTPATASSPSTSRGFLIPFSPPSPPTAAPAWA